MSLSQNQGGNLKTTWIWKENEIVRESMIGLCADLLANRGREQQACTGIWISLMFIFFCIRFLFGISGALALARTNDVDNFIFYSKAICQQHLFKVNDTLLFKVNDHNLEWNLLKYILLLC